MDNRKQRSTPSLSIPGSFGPYHKKDLEAARAQLIRDLYKHVSNPSGILTRVKLRCGILADRNGSFSGCEPHPVTNVSYESQSCELMVHDGFPWQKESTVIEEEIQNDSKSSEEEDTSYENTAIRINTQKNQMVIQQTDSEGRNSPQPSTSSSISNHLENNSKIEQGQKRKLEDCDNTILVSDGESDGILVSDEEGLQIVNSLSNSKESIQKKLKRNENKVVRKSEVITISDDSDNGAVQFNATCYRCDICDHVELKSHAMYKHLKSRDHYSASKCKGRKEGGNIIPKNLAHRMTHVYKSALFKHVVPVCTECNKVFTDIHMCSIHQQYFHDPNERFYSLGKIKNAVSVSVDPHPRCTQCNKQFPKLQNFLDHIKSVRHTNYPPLNYDETVGLSCDMCQVPKVFSGFDSILKHFMESHQQSDKSFGMTVYYIEKTNQAKVMLPFVGKHDNEQDTLIIMRRMRRETPGDGYNKILKKMMGRMKKS